MCHGSTGGFGWDRVWLREHNKADPRSIDSIDIGSSHRFYNGKSSACRFATAKGSIARNRNVASVDRIAGQCGSRSLGLVVTSDAAASLMARSFGFRLFLGGGLVSFCAIRMPDTASRVVRGRVAGRKAVIDLFVDARTRFVFGFLLRRGLDVAHCCLPYAGEGERKAPLHPPYV